MKVTKYSGELVHYDKQKLINSLEKSGASSAVISSILAIIETKLYEGIPSKQIYKLAFQLLKKNSSNVHAARYNLRTGILKLGPAGFFFEKFIAKVFQEQQFETKTNLTLNGNCVSHEIDVLLKKQDRISMVECKFHSGQDVKSDVKIPMYILSRFNDLKSKKHLLFLPNEIISQCILVSNNRFTTDAIQFGTCSGIQMLSWDYPPNNGIKDFVDLFGIYPITCLTTLSQFEKDKLLILDCITVKDLIVNPSHLHALEISHNRIKNILKEANQLLKI